MGRGSRHAPCRWLPPGCMSTGDGSPVPAVSESLSACAVVYSVSAQYPMLSKQRGKTLEELLTRVCVGVNVVMFVDVRGILKAGGCEFIAHIL